MWEYPLIDLNRWHKKQYFAEYHLMDFDIDSQPKVIMTSSVNQVCSWKYFEKNTSEAGNLLDIYMATPRKWSVEERLLGSKLKKAW